MMLGIEECRKLLSMSPRFAGWRCHRTIESSPFGTAFEIRKGGQRSRLELITIPFADPDYDDLCSMVEGDMDELARLVDEQVRLYLQREVQTQWLCRGQENIVELQDYDVLNALDGSARKTIMIRKEAAEKSDTWNKEWDHRCVAVMMRDVAKALVFLEGWGWLHRDIKPESVVVKDGVYKLTAFDVPQELRQTVMRGISFFGAPEAIMGQHCDIRADIYSLGMVAYTFLNRQRFPFQMLWNGDSMREAWKMRMEGTPIPPVSGADDDINRVLLKCLAYSPDERYPHAADLLRDLETLLRDKYGMPDRDFVGSRRGRWLKKLRAVLH